jgi:Ca2+/H+ antiporter
LNFFAHAFWPFFYNGWNWFNSAVVLISLGTIISSSSSNALVKQLRIFRVFRVIRVFGRVGQLREIVNAITMAIVPVLDALVRHHCCDL